MKRIEDNAITVSGIIATLQKVNEHFDELDEVDIKTIYIQQIVSALVDISVSLAMIADKEELASVRGAETIIEADKEAEDVRKPD